MSNIISFELSNQLKQSNLTENVEGNDTDVEGKPSKFDTQCTVSFRAFNHIIYMAYLIYASVGLLAG